MEVGDVQFPGRDRWETKLFAQKEELVKTIRTAVYAAREYLNFIRGEEGTGSLSKDDQLKLQESKTEVQEQTNNIFEQHATTSTMRLVKACVRRPNGNAR